MALVAIVNHGLGELLVKVMAKMWRGILQVADKVVEI
jgi:hypothetical protein